MKITSLLLAAAALTSCAGEGTDAMHRSTPGQGDPRTIKGIEPLLQKHVDAWTKEFGDIGDIPIQLADLPESKAGICTTYTTANGYEYKEIKIRKSWYYEIIGKNSDYLTSTADAQVEQVIFHELGHCVLDQDHRNGSSGGRPDSIMKSILFSGSQIRTYYSPERQEYLDELRYGGE